MMICTRSNYYLMSFGSSHLARWWLYFLENRVFNQSWRLMKLYTQFLPIGWRLDEPRLERRILAMSWTWDGRGAAPRWSNESIHWISDSSSSFVNLRPLVRFSARFMLPFNRRWSVVRGTSYRRAASRILVVSFFFKDEIASKILPSCWIDFCDLFLQFW